MLAHSCKVAKVIGFEKTIVGVALNLIKVFRDCVWQLCHTIQQLLSACGNNRDWASKFMRKFFNSLLRLLYFSLRLEKTFLACQVSHIDYNAFLVVKSDFISQETDYSIWFTSLRLVTVVVLLSRLFFAHKFVVLIEYEV